MPADVIGAPSLTLDEAQLGDLELLLSGAFAPLTGFMGAADAAAVIEPNDHGVDRDVGRKAGRQAFQIARDAMAVGTEQARDPDAMGILTQSILDRCQPPLRCIGCDDAQLLSEQSIDPGRHVGGRLPIDETEQHQGAQNERAGDAERPTKRGGAGKIRQAHGG